MCAKECREWCSGRAELKVHRLIEENVGEKDSRVLGWFCASWRERSVLDSSNSLKGKVISEQCGACRLTTYLKHEDRAEWSL